MSVVFLGRSYELYCIFWRKVEKRKRNEFLFVFYVFDLGFSNFFGS